MGAFIVITVLVSQKKNVTVTPNALCTSALGVTLVFDGIDWVFRGQRQ
jgi:hypothetical protein